MAVSDSNCAARSLPNTFQPATEAPGARKSCESFQKVKVLSLGQILQRPPIKHWDILASFSCRFPCLPGFDLNRVQGGHVLGMNHASEQINDSGLERCPKSSKSDGGLGCERRDVCLCLRWLSSAGMQPKTSAPARQRGSLGPVERFLSTKASCQTIDLPNWDFG